MGRLILRRIAGVVLTLWIVSVLVFAGTEMLPGDAATAILGQFATPDRVAAVRDRLDLDKPAPQRYVEWIAGAVHGDFGESVTASGSAASGSGVSVTHAIKQRLINSGLLALATAVIMFPLSVLLGVVAAVKPGRIVDTVITNSTLTLLALPEFIVGIVLVLLFAVHWHVFPAVSVISTSDPLSTRVNAMVLPVASLVLVGVGYTARMVRGSMIEALESDYVRMARLKGVPERRVIFRHALRNALVPSLQLVVFNVAWLVGGIVVVELVFAYPGIGQGLVQAVAARDFALVQAYALIVAATYLAVSLAADIGSIMLTPKLRERVS